MYLPTKLNIHISLWIDEEDKKNNQENNDGIYNYEEPTANKQDTENLATIEGYNESPRARRRRIQNPQHIKLMVKAYQYFASFKDVDLIRIFIINCYHIDYVTFLLFRCNPKVLLTHNHKLNSCNHSGHNFTLLI